MFLMEVFPSMDQPNGKRFSDLVRPLDKPKGGLMNQAVQGVSNGLALPLDRCHSVDTPDY
jgi:hypothetical protein